MKVSHILGLNARSQIFSYTYNKVRGKAIAVSKIRSKRVLKKADIPVPKLYAKFAHPRDILKFDWSSLPSSFALKPNKSLGGEGIIIVKKRAFRLPSVAQGKLAWITTQRSKVTIDDLKLHTMDILEGAFSLGNVPDIAFIEEYVGRHKAFKKYAFRGTPDIRVVVFNKVPVMAMLRLPTKESGGRANLHQGAIAVGIDIATGITTNAYWHGKYIYSKPGTKRKLNGIKIPNWTLILEIAVSCQMITDLGYVGVDIVLHPEKGPQVLELNPWPGLQIQLANLAGLKKRLERVEGLRVGSAEHGVKIAKALFMASFADRVRADEGVRTISAQQQVTIRGKKPNKKRIKVMAKIDTGAWRTSISERLADELGLLTPENILWTKKFKSSLGAQERPVVSVTFWLAGRKIITPASVAKRMALKYQMIIGRKNLKGFLVEPVIPTKGEERK